MRIFAPYVRLWKRTPDWLKALSILIGIVLALAITTVLAVITHGWFVAVLMTGIALAVFYLVIYLFITDDF